MKTPAPDTTGDRWHALVRDVIGGDPEALDAWFRSEHPNVFRLALGFLAERSEAEDLAQDAMLHLMDHLSRWDPHRPYRAWRDTVVLNLCRDRRRREAARGRALEGRLESVEPRTSEPPEAALEAGETQALLMEALAQLSPREREAFVLRDLEERSTAEAATALGVTESSVRSLLTLARRRLRGLLAEHVRAPFDPREDAP